MNKSIVFILAALFVLSACKPAPNATQELSTSELDSASAELDQLNQDVNEAEFESLEAELAELEGLEYG